MTEELHTAKIWLSGKDACSHWNFAALAEHLEQFAQLFARTGPTQHRGMIAEFHNIAGRLPYFQDRDIGALILERTADVSDSPPLRRFLYTEALFRAQWCAQDATSGGEGLARAGHLKQLEEKSRLLPP